MTWSRKFDVEKTLDKAMQVFWAHGYRATSMQDLVDQTGINRASMYGTYGDKRALFLSALDRYDNEVRKARLNQYGKMAPVDGIRCFLESFVADAETHDPVRGCFMTNTALELAPHDEEIRVAVEKAQQGIAEFFARMVRLGQEDGSIRSLVDPEEAGQLLLADMLGLVVLSRSRKDREILQAIVDQAIARLT